MRGSVSASSANSSPATNAGVALAGMPFVVLGSLSCVVAGRSLSAACRPFR